jgi:hypothetical protein
MTINFDLWLISALLSSYLSMNKDLRSAERLGRHRQRHFKRGHQNTHAPEADLIERGYQQPKPVHLKRQVKIL